MTRGAALTSMWHKGAHGERSATTRPSASTKPRKPFGSTPQGPYTFPTELHHRAAPAAAPGRRPVMRDVIAPGINTKLQSRSFRFHSATVRARAARLGQASVCFPGTTSASGE